MTITPLEDLAPLIRKGDKPALRAKAARVLLLLQCRARFAPHGYYVDHGQIVKYARSLGYVDTCDTLTELGHMALGHYALNKAVHYRNRMAWAKFEGLPDGGRLPMLKMMVGTTAPGTLEAPYVLLGTYQDDIGFLAPRTFAGLVRRLRDINLEAAA